MCIYMCVYMYMFTTYVLVMMQLRRTVTNVAYDVRSAWALRLFISLSVCDGHPKVDIMTGCAFPFLLSSFLYFCLCAFVSLFCPL